LQKTPPYPSSWSRTAGFGSSKFALDAASVFAGIIIVAMSTSDSVDGDRPSMPGDRAGDRRPTRHPHPHSNVINIRLDKYTTVTHGPAYDFHRFHVDRNLDASEKGPFRSVGTGQRGPLQVSMRFHRLRLSGFRSRRCPFQLSAVMWRSESGPSLTLTAELADLAPKSSAASAERRWPMSPYQWRQAAYGQAARSSSHYQY
jgi:hypothetical protein